MSVDPDVDAGCRVLYRTGVIINGVLGGTIARQKRRWREARTFDPGDAVDQRGVRGHG